MKSMKNIFEKVNDLKKLVKITVPEVNSDELHLFIDHVIRFQDGSRKCLTEIEQRIRETLLQQGYAAKSVRNWLRLDRLPEFLREEIRNGKRSFKNAIQFYQNHKLRTDREKEKEIVNDIRNFVNKDINEFVDGVLDHVRRRI
ncbi:hypothetical protein HZA97_01990 [Candidatus Woesearchaeota archaeon]|nr:hypothetical protein [Candidatus Woesearchaeota archaeon]